METKICNKCNNELLISSYFEYRTDTNKYRNQCRLCHKGYLSLLKDKQNRIIDLFSKGLKECGKCKKVLKVKNFNKDKTTVTGLTSTCRNCIVKYNRKNKDNNKRRTIRNRYNLDYSIYKKMIEEQEGKCAICTKEETLVIDHDHTTSKVRGLLCRQCNIGIGHLQDNVEILKSAITYIKHYK